MSDWFDKIPIFIQLEKNIESGQDYCFKISPFSSSNSLSLWSKNKTHIGDLVNGQVCFTVIPEMIGDELLLASADPIDTSNTLFCLQQGNFRCSPNPTELVHAKSYQLSQPLSLNTDYTLSVEGAQDDWVGVWLGEDYFAGYLEDDCHSFAIDNLWKDTDFIRTEASTKYLSYDENIIDKINQAGQARLSINIKIVNANPTGNNRIGCELGVIWDDDVNGILHCWYYPTGGETYQGRISKGHTLSKKIKSIRYAFCTIETDGDVYEISQPKITVKDNVYWSPHPSDFSHIILKSLSPTTCISKAMLSRSSVRQDWLMAPEDIYRHSYSRNYILQSGRAVDFAEQGDIATTVQDFEGRNLILNSALSSIDNWSRHNNHTTLSVSENILTGKGSGNSRLLMAWQQVDIPFEVGRKIYAKAKLRVLDTGAESLGLRVTNIGYSGAKYFGQVNFPDAGVWYYFSGIVTLGINLANTYFTPHVYFDDAANAKDKEFEVQGGTLYCVDLTKEFGPGNEPSEYFADWQPAPEDLTYAKQYQLAEPLKLNTDYTLSVEGDLDDWTGVWLGDGYFAGYLKDEELGLECRNRQPYIASGNYVATTSATFFDNGSARLTQPGGNDISGSLQLKPSVLPFVSAGSYTFSYKTDDGRKIRLITRGYDENKNPVSVGITGGGTYISSYKGWYQTGEFSTTVTIDAPVKYLSFALMYTETDGGSVLVYQTQLEHGDTATPYTPNPADFDSIIIKSLTDTASIDWVMLAESSTKQDWIPAPEDIYGLTAGSERVGHINYNGLIKSDGQMYGGTTNPSSTTRLNYDGNYVATELTAISRLKLSDNAYWQYNPSTNSVELIFL